ncbi:MAG: FtsX-like permease family protein, partial [Bacteroidota bacterium]
LDEKQGRDAVSLFLAKYGDQYLYNKYRDGVQSGGRIEQVNLFIIVAIFILLIACINFINLSTAQAAFKTREVGIRKTLGASRISLMSQYFIESTLLGLFALATAVGLVWLLIPQFNAVSNKEITLLFDSRLLVTGLSLVLLVGIAAGSYPAFYLSGIKILSVLKPGAFLLKSNGNARRALVVAQFAIAIVLISGTLMVRKQMDYVQQSNLGYDRENVVYFEREGKLLQETDAFLSEMGNIPGVQSAACSGFVIGGANSTAGISWEGKTDDDRLEFLETRCAYGSLEVLGVELLEGRMFSNSYGNDSSSIIFNETAIQEMGISNPIGKTVRHYSGNKKIIGVVKDFNMQSMHTRVSPAFFLFDPEETLFVMAKINKGTELNSIRQIAKTYEAFNPGYPFQPYFLDQDYTALYKSETQVATLSGYFAALAILISCLGLFGLVTFTNQKRQKEIGIRKVLGSGTWKIVLLITKDFTGMVLLAIIIAVPLSYIAGKQWLENFAYRIEPEWWWYALVGLCALTISWLTVGAQTFKAATANPAESLKDE